MYLYLYLYIYIYIYEPDCGLVLAISWNIDLGLTFVTH